MERLRTEFPVTEERAYLIVGAIAPAARPVMARTRAWLERWANHPLENFERWGQEVDALRDAIARLIGADASEIAITDGTSRAANIAIELLAERSGSCVVVDPTTYPSSLYPWLTKSRKRLVFSSRELSVEDWPLSRGTELVATCISHVAWQTGHRHDLAEIGRLTRDHGGLMMVDAAQSAGCVPIDVRRDGVDMLVGTSMKWLLGPPGIGFLYVRGDLLDGPPPRDVGYVGIRVDQEVWPPPTTLDMLPGARRFELGVPNLMGVPGALAGLELLERASVTEIADHVERLVSRGIEGLRDLDIEVRTPADPRYRAGVIAAHLADATGLAADLRSRGVDVMGFPSGLLRIDPAGFNTADEIDVALEEIGRLVR